MSIDLLLLNVMKIIIFLDPCGYYFRRFPDEEYGDKKVGENIFYIESQVQADNFNCSSYCFEFIKELVGIIAKNKKWMSLINI